MPLMCAWCLYQRVRGWIKMDKVRDANTIVGGDALCAEHFVDWTVLRATLHSASSRIPNFLKEEKR